MPAKKLCTVPHKWLVTAKPETQRRIQRSKLTYSLSSRGLSGRAAAVNDARSSSGQKGSESNQPSGRSEQSYVRRGFEVRRASNIQISHIEGILLNELPAWLDHITHQLDKNIVRFVSLTNFHLEQ